MAFIQYLTFGSESLPLPDSYAVAMEDVESDYGSETEAGTVQRDVIRAGVRTISVTFSVTSGWLKKFTAYQKESVISVTFFDTQTLGYTTADMYIENYRVSLVKDTSYKSLWKVSFDLHEY